MLYCSKRGTGGQFPFQTLFSCSPTTGSRLRHTQTHTLLCLSLSLLILSLLNTYRLRSNKYTKGATSIMTQISGRAKREVQPIKSTALIFASSFGNCGVSFDSSWLPFALYSAEAPTRIESRVRGSVPEHVGHGCVILFLSLRHGACRFVCLPSTATRPSARQRVRTCFTFALILVDAAVVTAEVSLPLPTPLLDKGIRSPILVVAQEVAILLLGAQFPPSPLNPIRSPVR